MDIKIFRPPDPPVDKKTRLFLRKISFFCAGVSALSCMAGFVYIDQVVHARGMGQWFIIIYLLFNGLVSVAGFILGVAVIFMKTKGLPFRFGAAILNVVAFGMNGIIYMTIILVAVGAGSH